MEGDFIWRDAERDDRPLLQQFCCTPPAPRGPGRRPLAHPRQWERDVEVWFRTRTPPAGPAEVMRLLTDDVAVRAAHGLAAISHRQRGLVVLIQAVAVCMKDRGHGGAVADNAIEDALMCAMRLGNEASAATILVLARVDERNLPSAAMFERAGFGLAGPTEGPFTEWVLQLESDHAPDTFSEP